MVYEKNAFSTPFLRGYKLLKIPIVNANGEPAWPELFPMDAIEQLRETVGVRHFMSQMMLDFVPIERARLDPGGVRFYEEEFDVRSAKIGSHLITGVTLYWDPSTGRKKRDSSACALLFRDDKNRCVFLHDVLYLTVDESEAFPLSRQCDMVLDFMGSRKINRITIETNGLGIGVPEIMRDCATRRGICVHVISQKNNKPKSERILNAIEPLLSTGRLYAHTRVRQTPLMSEMLGWTPVGAYGVHDDGLDAVAGAITQTPIPVRASGAVQKTFSANTNFSI